MVAHIYNVQDQILPFWYVVNGTTLCFMIEAGRTVPITLDYILPQTRRFLQDRHIRRTDGDWRGIPQWPGQEIPNPVIPPEIPLGGTAATREWAATQYAPLGAVTAAGLTMATNKILGRKTAGTGAVEEIGLAGNIDVIGANLNLTQNTGKLIGRTSAGSGASEEITVGSGLSLAAGTLSATGGGVGGVTEAQIRALGPKIWFEGRAMRGTPTAIDRWIDLSGNNNHATAAANHPKVSSLLCNGKPAVRFDDTKEFVIPAINTRNAWIVARCDNVADTNIWISDGSNYVAMTWPTLGGKTATNGFGDSTDYGYSKTFTSPAWRMHTFSNQSLPHYMTVLPNTFTTIGVDGYELLQTSAIASFSPTILGGHGGATYDCNADVAAVIVFDRTLAQWERDLVSRYLDQQFALNLPRYNRLFLLGDSITAGSGLAATDTLPRKLLGISSAVGLLGTEWTGIPYAASGWTAQELSMMCEPALAMASSLCNNVAMIFIGTNNGSPETAASVADRVADICLRARAYGCRTLLVPMLPKGDGSSEAWRGDFNTAQANIVAAGKADRIIPQSDQPLLWNAGAQNNATYFNADKLHLVAAGQTLLSAAAAPHITALAALGNL